MGRVKNKIIKRIARMLIKLYPDKFNEDFENNKNILKNMPELKLSKKQRNQVAGYIVRLVKFSKKEAES